MSAGKITRIAVQDKNPNRASVYLDGAFAFGVYQDLILEFDLRVGRVLAETDVQRITEADALLAAKAAAVSYLAYKARTEQEVRSKLARSDFGEDVIEKVIERLYGLGYLDDAAYARAFVNGRFRNRGYGPERLRSDLLRRGVDRNLADETLADALEPDETLSAARAQAEKRWARLASEADPRKRRKKLYDFLLRRGFSYDTARQVVDVVARD